MWRYVFVISVKGIGDIRGIVVNVKHSHDNIVKTAGIYQSFGVAPFAMLKLLNYVVASQGRESRSTHKF